MKNTTQVPKGQGCVVLTHPRFDRPKVENPKFPGPKRGCLSFTKGRYKRMDKQIAARRQTEGVAPRSVNDRVASLADYIQAVFTVDAVTARCMAGAAGGEFKRRQAGGAA